MAGEADMTSWTDLLNNSTKLLQQAAPSTEFPPIQRSLDQLEALSNKLKAKTSRLEVPSHNIAATRLLAREGINAEQLARDLKSFELRVHEMAMLSAIQAAQRDNLRSFDDYMLQVLEDDWEKEKRDFLLNMSRLPTISKANGGISSSGISQSVRSLSGTATPHLSQGAQSMEIVPATEKPFLEKKASAYADVVRNLNAERERGLPFKVATAFKTTYEELASETSGSKSVSMQKIWNLLQALLGEDKEAPKNLSRKMVMVIGARRHLEAGYEKYILDTIHSHAAQAALGGATGNLQRIRAFLRVRLRDHPVLDFDASDGRRHPPVDTTWQQIYFCLRTGYYDEARSVAQSSRVSQMFAPQLAEWISSGGMVSSGTSTLVAEECERMLRLGDRAGRAGYDKHKLLLYAIVSGSRQQIDRLLRDLPTLFSTIEDFLWFKLAVVRDTGGASSSLALVPEGLAPYSLEDLQNYLNKFEPSYYTKNGKDPLVYPYVLLLSIQLQLAVQYLTKEAGNEGYNIDAVHISIALADHGVLSEGVGSGHKLGIMDAVAEIASIIQQYGSLYVRLGNLSLALEYYAQAASAMGGGAPSWMGHTSVDQQRQREIMLKQLLTEILLREGGIMLLLGPNGTGSEGALRRFLPDRQTQHLFLLEAARHCQESGLYDKSVEIQKRVGAFAMALQTINNCLSEAIGAIARGRADGDTRTAGLVYSGNDIIEAYKFSGVTSIQERDQIAERQTTLRQLEAILAVHKFARSGRYGESLRELTKLSFLPLDSRSPDITADAFQNLSPPVQACIPDVLKVALTCLDNVTDTDGTVRVLRRKIANFVANYLPRNWPQELYDKVAQML
ncbi:nuclear pore complex protein NUP93A isoform X2 [Cryptomeria japonica]|uniref:nuclear pore complex protein NUP93A isoform X2 n=1 Tax=Cryptomeria japonica TaxID=3369 RepID=UPI0027DA5C9F|nr:nuclear pore complex protein NUP93A isoform X2 [Cryptomeria japonica]